jgi:hypothetical protein
MIELGQREKPPRTAFRVLLFLSVGGGRMDRNRLIVDALRPLFAAIRVFGKYDNLR